MSKPDKAQITYYVGEGEGVKSVLRFHSVIAEEHEATSEITKFPVQTGFNISNHAIKKNRVVTITGAVSNHMIVGAEEFHQYGNNNVRLMFDTLKDLVRLAKPCEVTTNYGKYNPVIFNKFKTKLVAGKTDMMEFTMRGEEAMVGTTVNGNKPTLLVFTPLSPTNRKARVTELAAAGMVVSDKAVLSEAECDMNGSFQIESVDSAGTKSITTYEKIYTDPTSDLATHKVHTTATDVVKAEKEKYLNWNQIIEEEKKALALPDIDLSAGLETASACIKDKAIGLGKKLASDEIETAMGDLKKSVYGAAYEVFGVNGNQSLGQVVLSLGVDCVIAGAIGTADLSINPDSFQENDVPTVDQVLGGAAELGNRAAKDVLNVNAPTTLTKISTPSEDANFFGSLL